MSTVRVMNGVADMTGRRVNTLRVEEMVRRNPEPRYLTRCETCGCKSTASQRQLVTGIAKCLASDCGKAALREYLADTPRKAAAREAERQRAAVAAAERTFKETANAINRTVRERIEGGRDNEIYISPALRSVSMTDVQAAQFNKSEATKFIAGTPEYGAFRTDENLNIIGEYFERNGVRIADAEMIRRAFFRLREYGLLASRPVPDEQPAQVDAPPVEPLAPIPTGPKVFIGRDWETGRDREFTEVEVERMSSEQFARTFKVAKTVAGLFTAVKQERGEL